MDDETDEHGITKPNRTDDFAACEAENLWGTGRWARNLPTWRITDPGKHFMIEIGLHNYFDTWARPSRLGQVVD